MTYSTHKYIPTCECNIIYMIWLEQEIDVIHPDEDTKQGMEKSGYKRKH